VTSYQGYLGHQTEPSTENVLGRRATVVALANQKGGVGKSTTTINLGAGLALQGERVLLVDIDPQANTTSGLGIDRERLARTIYDVLVEDIAVEDVIEPTSMRDLFVLPSTIELAGAEIELVSMLARENRLRNAIDKVRGEFDFILVDCPPSLGLLSINGLTAADEVLIPIQCEYYALEGVGLLMRNIGLVRRQLNPELDVEGMVLTMFDGRTTLSSDVVRQVREHFGDTTYRTVVPRTVRLSEAPSYGEPIEAFDPMSRGAIAYRELAREFRRRHGRT
jgi:chromosome partitioning protein